MKIDFKALVDNFFFQVVVVYIFMEIKIVERIVERVLKETNQQTKKEFISEGKQKKFKKFSPCL